MDPYRRLLVDAEDAATATLLAVAVIGDGGMPLVDFVLGTTTPTAELEAVGGADGAVAFVTVPLVAAIAVGEYRPPLRCWPWCCLRCCWWECPRWSSEFGGRRRLDEEVCRPILVEFALSLQRNFLSILLQFVLKKSLNSFCCKRAVSISC